MSKYAPHSGRFSQAKATSSTVCQKCLERGTWGQGQSGFRNNANELKIGHYTFECKNSRPYVSRPSRTQQLENPKLQEKLRSTVEVPDEFKKKPRVSLFFSITNLLMLYFTGLDWLLKYSKREKRLARKWSQRKKMSIK